MNIKEFMERDTALRHAIRTGIKYEYELGEDAIFHRNNPELSRILKHIRTGLNCAMVEHATVIHLLKDKGLITEEEYFNKALKMLELEVKQLEQSLQETLGITIRLG